MRRIPANRHDGTDQRIMFLAGPYNSRLLKHGGTDADTLSDQRLTNRRTALNGDFNLFTGVWTTSEKDFGSRCSSVEMTFLFKLSRNGERPGDNGLKPILRRKKLA